MVEKKGGHMPEGGRKKESGAFWICRVCICACVGGGREEKSAGLSGGGGAQVWRIVCPATCMHYYRGLQLCAGEIRDGADPLLVSPG